MKAAQFGYLGIVKLLCSRGADVHLKDEQYCTALIWSIVHDHEEVARFLLDQGAAATSHEEGSRTPLMWASLYGNEVVVQLLLERGVAVDARHSMGVNTTALMDAARSGCLNIVRMLLAAGADAALKDSSGKTAAQLAKTGGFKDIAQLLKQAEKERPAAVSKKKSTAKRKSTALAKETDPELGGNGAEVSEEAEESLNNLPK